MWRGGVLCLSPARPTLGGRRDDRQDVAKGSVRQSSPDCSTCLNWQAAFCEPRICRHFEPSRGYIDQLALTRRAKVAEACAPITWTSSWCMAKSSTDLSMSIAHIDFKQYFQSILTWRESSRRGDEVVARTLCDLEKWLVCVGRCQSDMPRWIGACRQSESPCS